MTEPTYFENLYAADPDPWDLDDRPYERRKRELTVASLPKARYRRGFEPGCANGALTALLAPRCDVLVATDPIDAPLDRARQVVNGPGVSFSRGSIPRDWPEAPFDLIVISEVLYYLDAADRSRVLTRCVESLDPDGHLVLVHWRHAFAEADCTGDAVHDEARRCEALVTSVLHEELDFVLEVFAPVTA